MMGLLYSYIGVRFEKIENYTFLVPFFKCILEKKKSCFHCTNHFYSNRNERVNLNSLFFFTFVLYIVFLLFLYCFTRLSSIGKSSSSFFLRYLFHCSS